MGYVSGRGRRFISNVLSQHHDDTAGVVEAVPEPATGAASRVIVVLLSGEKLGLLRAPNAEMPGVELLPLKNRFKALKLWLEVQQGPLAKK